MQESSINKTNTKAQQLSAFNSQYKEEKLQ